MAAPMPRLAPAISAMRPSAQRVWWSFFLLRWTSPDGRHGCSPSRIARLIEAHGVRPNRFTNKAAGEMKERVGRLLGRDPAGLWIGTFQLETPDSSTARPRSSASPGSIYDEDDRNALMGGLLDDLGYDKKKMPARAVADARGQPDGGAQRAGALQPVRPDGEGRRRGHCLDVHRPTRSMTCSCIRCGSSTSIPTGWKAWRHRFDSSWSNRSSRTPTWRRCPALGFYQVLAGEAAVSPVAFAASKGVVLIPTTWISPPW